MSILYSESGGLHNAAIGKLETPIKMIIEHESDLLTKRGGILLTTFTFSRYPPESASPKTASQSPPKYIRAESK